MTELELAVLRANVGVAFVAYMHNPSATNYAQLEQAMLEYQDAIYGDHRG